MVNSTKNQVPEEGLPAELVEVTPPFQMRISKIASWVLYVWAMIGIVALSVRVFFLLFSANSTAPFVDFVYRLSSDYLAPFRGIFPPHAVGETGYLDIAALFAIFVYLVLVWLLSSLIKYIQEKIDQHDREQRRLIAHKQRQAAKAHQR